MDWTTRCALSPLGLALALLQEKPMSQNEILDHAKRIWNGNGEGPQCYQDPDRAIRSGLEVLLENGVAWVDDSGRIHVDFAKLHPYTILAVSRNREYLRRIGLLGG